MEHLFFIQALMRKIVNLYTDGAYSRSRNVGAYAYKLQYCEVEYDQILKIISEKTDAVCVESTTNNRMELRAVIEGLRALKRPCTVYVYSDSTYVVDTINKWISSFIRDPKRLNHDLMIDLWKEILKQTHVKAIWIRGHDGHPENDIVNELAQKACGTWKEKKKK